MSYDPAPVPQNFPQAEEAWQELDDLVDEIVRLAGSDLSAPEFHQSLLDRAVRGLAAVGGAIWIRNSAGQIRLECQVNLDGVPLAANWADAQRHTRLLENVLSQGSGRFVAPLATVPGETLAANPTAFLLLLAPLAVDVGTLGIIEVFQRPSASPGSERGNLRFLATLNDLAADFQRNRQLRQLREREHLWQMFDRFVEQAHASLNLRTTAYTIANNARPLVGCDRISVGMFRGKRCRTLAISGADRFDPRSESVRFLEQVAAAVAKTEEPFWHDDERAPCPPQIETPLEALADETHARAIALIPLWAEATPYSDESAGALHRRGKPLGMLVVEKFDDGRFDPAQRERILAVARHSAVALSNAHDYQSIPLRPTLEALGRVRWFAQAKQLPKTAAALAIAVAAILALVLIPADFNITAHGQLQPERRREVFAPADGIVDPLTVDHGDMVVKGAELGRLRRPQLDFEATRVAGEIKTAQKRLASIQSSRLAGGRDAPSTTEKLNQLTAEEEETKAQLASLMNQQKILDAQEAELELHSPLAGTVLTWNVQELLAARPVTRGQALLTVADLSGPWIVELRVPDDRIGHVLVAEDERTRIKSDEQLAASFLLATEPGKSHVGKVEKISLAADADKTSDKATGTTVEVTLSFDRAQIPSDELRPGATVVGKIHCGRRSLGYVWLHELWEAIQSHLLF
jgi:multidrug efflux pump subunit AcrA (membrane-fusion protein)